VRQRESVGSDASKIFRRQVEQGLEGNPHEAGEARVVLKQWLCGRIDLKREGETLWAEYGEQPAALPQVVGQTGTLGRVGNGGSGGVIRNSTHLNCREIFFDLSVRSVESGAKSPVQRRRST
jgi:hypothetical protein